MSRLMRWAVPDRIAPTALDTLFISLHVALMRLPYVLDGAMRKALVAPSWSDFWDMATRDERAVMTRLLQGFR